RGRLRRRHPPGAGQPVRPSLGDRAGSGERGEAARGGRSARHGLGGRPWPRGGRAVLFRRPRGRLRAELDRRGQNPGRDFRSPARESVAHLPETRRRGGGAGRARGRVPANRAGAPDRRRLPLPPPRRSVADSAFPAEAPAGPPPVPPRAPARWIRAGRLCGARRKGEMSRDCPICGSTGPRKLMHRQRFLEGPLGGGYDVVVCENCGAGFADGIPSQEELDCYYAERSKYEYDQRSGAESPYDLRRFEHIITQLAPWVPQRSASILDVGCATGGLLACLAAAGYTRLLGCDPSPACAAAARRLHGIEVLALDIGQLAQTGRRFDVILAVGVLEHLHEVGAAVDGLAGLLNPGGLVYCAQPDTEAFAACVNAPYQQFSTEHVVFFSEASLGRLMAERGFEPRQTWRWMTEWREGMSDSVVSGIYRRSEGGTPVRKRDE